MWGRGQNVNPGGVSAPQGTDKPRVSGIDLFRGTLVVMVMLGHFAELSDPHHFLTWLGYGFRMPLFIGLTGYLFNLEQARRLAPRALLRKYYDRLILPWIAASAVAIVITGSLEWYSPIYAIIRPPYHLWFVPIILAFMLAASASRLSPPALLAVAIPTSIGAMYLFGVGHEVSQFGPWMPDRRYFIYPIYFAFGLWVARFRTDPSHRRLSWLVALTGLLWWSRLYLHPSTAAEAAAELLFCIPLIALFPLLRRISFDIPWLSAIGRDSLFFYLWHPLAFAVWSAAGASGVSFLALSAGTILIAWKAIARLPDLAGVLGVRPAGSPAFAGAAAKLPESGNPS
jgi:fucose 4-O-acetylase-like acetyltransferase